MRKSGILLPISSIPSKYGIGTFSKEAYAFVDFLEQAGQKLWQILPLGPTGYGDSPYQSFSTFAGNPYFIDLDTLVKEGYLTKAFCNKFEFGSNPEYVDYGKLYENRFVVLRKAYETAVKKGLTESKEYKAFIKENAFWLKDYALYMAVKQGFNNACWTDWEEDIRLRKEEAMVAYSAKYEEEIGFYYFQQFMFRKQWSALKAYANKKGIEIIGDIPIYVAFDSADAWANPELFQLDEDNVPIGVAGCPPDAFCATGQLWGNPLYKWDYHKKTEYAWWIKRISFCYELYDIVRIDHFRGFDEYWFVPYGDETAQFGHWTAGPGYDLFKTMKEKLGEKNVIAEDLGFLTDTVIELLKQTGYPGMKILQFGFGSDDSEYLPHNYPQNCICYTGTHDNETALGWFKGLDRKTKKQLREYMNLKDDKDFVWEFIRMVMASVADTAVIPMQDYLELDNRARINHPSTLGANWQWRMKADACTKELAKKIKRITLTYSR